MRFSNESQRVTHSCMQNEFRVRRSRDPLRKMTCELLRFVVVVSWFRHEFIKAKRPRAELIGLIVDGHGSTTIWHTVYGARIVISWKRETTRRHVTFIGKKVVGTSMLSHAKLLYSYCSSLWCQRTVNSELTKTDQISSMWFETTAYGCVSSKNRVQMRLSLRMRSSLMIILASN